MRITPKNWTSFQHYKDRSPPWIKLHKALLDDRTFQRLPVASRALAPMLWLLASESKDGTFDASTEELSFRLRASEKEVEAGLKPLISAGFFIPVQGDSSVLADGKRTAAPEGEREAEKEGEPRKRVLALSRPEDITEQTWTDWLHLRKTKRAPVTETVLAGARAEAKKAGLDLEQFLRVWCTRGSQGLQADWLKPEERGRAQAAAGRHHDSAEDTARMLSESSRDTKPPPAHIREQINAALRGGKALQ
jgi:hypothetical protein